MKFGFKLSDSIGVEAEADVERLIEKGMDQHAAKPPKPPKKTRFQIKQEELRKNEELKHKQKMQKLLVGFGAVAAIIVLFAIMLILDSQGII